MYEKGLMDERKAAQYYARIESGEEADVAAFADVDVEEHNRLAQAGIARTTLRTGDVPRGIGLAVNSENSALQRECGAILEAMKQWQVKTPPLSPLRFSPKVSPKLWPVLASKIDIGFLWAGRRDALREGRRLREGG